MQIVYILKTFDFGTIDIFWVARCVKFRKPDLSPSLGDIKR